VSQEWSSLSTIHIHTTVVNSGRTHSTLNTAHTVDSDCGYNPDAAATPPSPK